MRFVNIKDRKFATVIFQFSYLFIDKYFKLIKHAKWNFHKWKGLTLMKDPMTLSTYMMMLQEIKPKTILDIGGNDGTLLKSFQKCSKEKLRLINVDASLSFKDEQSLFWIP